MSWEQWQLCARDSVAARLDAADEVGQGGVLDQARQLAPVRCGHQLHPSLRNAPRGQCLSLRPDLILQMMPICKGAQITRICMKATNAL